MKYFITLAKNYSEKIFRFPYALIIFEYNTLLTLTKGMINLA